MTLLKPLILGLACLGLAACSWIFDSPYDKQQDAAPVRKLDPDKIRDAVPRREVITASGNTSPYEVFGRRYELMTDYKRYKARGVASWYGTKFHGRLTSNGEVYNLYEMTAAHKTLPIPVYVRVTNLNNGRSAIVRVNDRGPFHGDRLIDLSYAAAVKLGYADQGTAPVEIEVIDLDNSPGNPGGGIATPRYFLQLGAFRAKDSALNLQSEVASRLSVPVEVSQSVDRPVLHRVRVGPFTDYLEAERVRRDLVANNYGQATIITENARPQR